MVVAFYFRLHLAYFPRPVVAIFARPEHRLEDLRVDHDKSQIEIAAYLNMNRNVYWRYEKGVREIPAWAVIKLADYYHVSTDYLLGRTDRPEPYPAK